MNASEDWVVVEQTRRIMATRMSIQIAVAPGDAATANATIARAMAWLETLSDRLTRFSTQSELAQLNASAGRWCAVSGTLFSVVAESMRAARATDGLFDPALLPLLEAIGYDRDYDEIEHRDIGPARDAQLTTGTWRDIELDVRRLRILLPEGTRLDLGGIAKGWAADAVLARHLARYDNVLVDAGGDMRALGGSGPDEPWAIAIGNPLAISSTKSVAESPENAAVLTMRRGGIATSGASGRWWYQSGTRRHHLLDPRTGNPVAMYIDTNDRQDDSAPLIASVTALASTTAHAEVAAKVALLRGYPAALQYVESAWGAQRPEPVIDYGDNGVALLLVLGTGAVVYSTNIYDYLREVGGDLWLD